MVLMYKTVVLLSLSGTDRYQASQSCDSSTSVVVFQLSYREKMSKINS